MSELELQLLRFLENGFSSLSAEEKVCYEDMLSREDWEIFDWVQGRAKPKGEIEKRVVARIRDANTGLENW